MSEINVHGRMLYYGPNILEERRRRGQRMPWEDPHEGGRQKYYKLKPGDVYVGAGEFLGQFGPIASKKVGPKGKVVLIEPCPQFLEVANEMIRVLGLTNVIPVGKAVWSSRCKKFLYLTPTWINNRLMHAIPSETRKPQHVHLREIIEVEVDTIDNILDDLGIEHVDLLRADVENAEYEMVKGMERCLSEKRIRNMAIAAYHKHPTGWYEEIMTELKRHGYSWMNEWHGIVYAHV